MGGIRRLACTALALFGLAAAPLGAGDVFNGGGVFLGATLSGNWAGYVVPAAGTTSVAADWTVPAAAPHNGQGGSSSAWVGVGAGNPDLIQAGTESDVNSSGSATYFAWWEALPSPARKVRLAVQPGDRVHVSVAESAPGVWAISISDLSSGQAFATATSYASNHGQADWIVERPFVSNKLAGLPELSGAGFNGGSLNGAPVNLSSRQGYQMWTLDLSTTLATPSRPSQSQDGFAVCTYAATCAKP